MWTTRTRSVVIGGGAAALIAAAGAVGGFAAAHAANTTPATSVAVGTSTAGPSATTAPSGPAGAKADRKHAKGDLVTRLKGLQHAQWVVADKDGAFVTRDAIRGTVTAVSATSLTVKAKDGVSQTYTVGASTKVTLRPAKGRATGATASPAAGAAGAARGSISDVTSGAEVVVSGTGTTSLTADRVLVPAS
ncbi:hypothetical protein V3N99_02140 [Dermatophilaceae bacterium Soc4.6]